ncbi:MAG TPA: hypothetical protein DCP69_06945 [Candidatus Omnitrophica bacterium]|nr:hypothetical protein [Candidatus Omnitrophota bacterium]
MLLFMSVSIGLEIGSAAVRAVLLDPRSKPPRLLAAVGAPWSGTGGDDLLRAIQQVRRSLPIKSPVVLGLPTPAAIITTVQPLLVSRARSDLAVRFELQQQLPYDVSQTAWHYHWLSHNGGTQAEPGPAAVVAAVKHSIVQERLTLCQRAGVSVKGVQVNALALGNAWWQAGGPGGRTASVVVRLDGRLLEWLIITSNGLYVFTTLLPAPTLAPHGGAGPVPAASTHGRPGPVPPAAPLGAASVVSAGLSQSQEDQLVARLATSWEGLQKHLAAVTGACPSISAAQLVGDTSSYPTCAEGLQRAIGCAVQPLSLETIVRAEKGGDEFVAACGLALQGGGHAPLSLNLIEGAMRAARAARVNRVSQLLGVLCALLATLWSGRGIVESLRSREALLEQYHTQEQSYQLLRPEVRAIRKHQAQLEHRLEQLAYLARTRDRVTRSVVQLTDALPDSLWLTTLDLTKTAPHVAGALEGYAQSFQGVTQFIDRVKAAPEWVTVKPQATSVMTDSATGAEVVAFTIQLQRLLVEPSADRPRAEEEPAAQPAAKKKPSSSRRKQR